MKMFSCINLEQKALVEQLVPLSFALSHSFFSSISLSLFLSLPFIPQVFMFKDLGRHFSGPLLVRSIRHFRDLFQELASNCQPGVL